MVHLCERHRITAASLCCLAFLLQMGCTFPALHWDPCPCESGWTCDTRIDRCLPSEPSVLGSVLDAEPDVGTPGSDGPAVPDGGSPDAKLGMGDAGFGGETTTDGGIGPSDGGGDAIDGPDAAGDGCPDDESKTVQGQCGCGVPDTDRDEDGAADCVDGCPTDANKQAPGSCGCGATEASCTMTCASQLLPTQELLVGDYLCSDNRTVRLVMGGDGNLQLWVRGEQVWSSGICCGGDHARMQVDGNFVLRDSSGLPLWSSRTPGNDNAILQVLDDGRATIDLKGKVLWSVGPFE